MLCLLLLNINLFSHVLHVVIVLSLGIVTVVLHVRHLLVVTRCWHSLEVSAAFFSVETVVVEVFNTGGLSRVLLLLMHHLLTLVHHSVGISRSHYLDLAQLRACLVVSFFKKFDHLVLQ